MQLPVELQLALQMPAPLIMRLCCLFAQVDLSVENGQCRKPGVGQISQAFVGCPAIILVGRRFFGSVPTVDQGANIVREHFGQVVVIVKFIFIANPDKALDSLCDGHDKFSGRNVFIQTNSVAWAYLHPPHPLLHSPCSLAGNGQG
jgi:hypothetical protein